MKEALRQLRDHQKQRKRKERRKRYQEEGFREIVLDGADGIPLSKALLDLTQETSLARHRLMEEQPRVALRPYIGLGEGDETSQRAAERASRNMKEDMTRRGVPERTHYYSSSERRETGEIDRTYVIRKGRKRSDHPARRK